MRRRQGAVPRGRRPGVEVEGLERRELLAAGVSAAADIPPFVVSVSRTSGNHQPGVFVLGFNEALTTASADNVFNYTLIDLGRSGQLDTANQIAAGHARNVYLHVTTATFDATTNAVTLTTYERLRENEPYLLVVNGRLAHPTANGESPDGLADTAGSLLDGNFNGAAGSDYVTLLPQTGAPLVAATSTATHHGHARRR